MKRLHVLLGFTAILTLGFGSWALSNYQITQGGTTTILAIDASNQGTALCAAANTECPSHVPINTAGAPMFTTAVPGVVSPSTAGAWAIGSSTQNSAIVANGHLALAQFNTTPTTITAGNMSPLQMDSSGNLKVIGVGLAQGSTTSGQAGALMLGAVTTAAPSYTTAQTNPLSLDANGALRVNVTSGGGTGGTSSTFGAAFPGTGTAVGMTQGGNMVAMTGTAGSLNVNCSSGCAAPTPASTASAIPAGTVTAVVVKGSAGTLMGIQVYNITANPAYVKIYNNASACTGTPVKRLMIPAAATAANGAGSNVAFGGGITFSTGIVYCVTTDITDANSGAPATNSTLINVDFL